MNTHIRTTAGSDIALFYKSGQGITGLTVTATIYDIDKNVIDTQTLDEISAGLYLKKYTVPSGYEVLLADYAVNDNIAELATDYIYVKSSLGGGGGGGGRLGGKVSIDKEQKKELVKEIGEYLLEKILPEIEKKSEFNPSIQKVLVDLSGVEKKIDGIIIPEQKDYTAHFSEIKSEFKKNRILTDKELAKIKKEIKDNKTVIDLTPLNEKIDHLKAVERAANNYEQIVSLEKNLSLLFDKLSSALPKDNSEKIIKTIDGIKKTFNAETDNLKKASTITIQDISGLTGKMEMLFEQILKTEKLNQKILEKFDKELPDKFGDIIVFIQDRIAKVIKEIQKKDFNGEEFLRKLNLGFNQLKNDLLDNEEI